MPFAPGDSLGPYQILGTLGAGGMGTVYRAQDTRLSRLVALKVMGGSLTGPGDREVLEREARAVAALNHQHICALHDVGRENDVSFLVMEFVDGETLAARIARGPLPIREIVRYAIQIAEALDHAHRHGVMHRDLKPSNIMLTRAGVKVLDFGLATLHGGTPLQMPVDRTPTARHQLTSERTLLGTVHYMAPERLEGRDANAVSDLFAFGAVLYEMCTGRRPFESGSSAAVIAAILHTDPPAPSTIRPDIPPPIDWIVQKSLAKSPEARWQAAGDIVEVLRWLARDTGRRPESPASWRRWLVPLAALSSALLLGVLVLLFARGFDRAAPAPPVLSFSVLPPAAGGFTPTPSSVPTPQFALSPDGARLVFVASVAPDPPQLWVRPLDSLTAVPVPGTHGAEYPFWSPDSQSIGFFANGSLKRIDLSGGPARVLAPAPHGRGGAWSRSGIIIFTPSTQSALLRIPAAGGEAVPLTRVEPGGAEASHRWPQFLPDDRHFIFFVQGRESEAHGIHLGSLDGGPPRKLVMSGLSAAFVAPDRLLFVADDALVAMRLDQTRQELVGEPMPVASPVAGSSNFYAAFSASQTGLLAYASSAASAELVWVDRAGRKQGSVGPPAEYVDFRLSPHDQHLAVAEVDPQTHRPDIRVVDLLRGPKTRLTYEAATDASPIWSPDAQWIVFRSNRGGLHDVYQKPANGAGQSSLLLQSRNAKYPTDWLPDGRGIVYHTYNRETGSDIWLMSPDGSTSTPLVQTAFDEMQGQVSPDGRWLAYTSLESGQPEVHIRSLSDGNQRWQVSAGGGIDPRWRGDSGEVFYISGDSKLTAVSFEEGKPEAPNALFSVRHAPPGNPYLSNYDVTVDGNRFLLKVPVHDVTSTPIHIVTNWMAGKADRQ